MKNLFEEMKTWNKRLIVLMVFVSILAISMLVYSITVGWMLFYPYDPLRVDRIDLDKATAAQGEEVCFQFYGEKKMDIPARISVELVNAQNYEVAKYSSYYPPTCTFKRRCFIVPYNVRPHNYALRWTAIYEVNGLRNITRSFTGGLLTVTEADLKGDKGKQGKQGIQGIKGDRGVKGNSGKNCIGLFC